MYVAHCTTNRKAFQFKLLHKWGQHAWFFKYFYKVAAALRTQNKAGPIFNKGELM
jgi:hypothetical protein